VKKSIYLGLYLSGLKKDKSSLIVLENFEGQKRLVISKIASSFKGNLNTLMPDELLLSEIKSYENPVAIGVNFPTFYPPCVQCKLTCPGVKKCSVLEVKTLNREFNKKIKLTNKSKKHVPHPAPYVERAIDYYTSYLLEEGFPFEPAFSTNRATLLTRGMFLKKHLKKLPFVECSTKVSLWRIGRSYKIRKSVLRNFYKDPTDISRALFLDKLEQDFFLYEEDRRTFLDDKNAFEALLCALSVYYFKNKMVEKVPRSFLPEGELFSLPL
jgi:hypothetical protein